MKRAVAGRDQHPGRVLLSQRRERAGVVSRPPAAGLVVRLAGGEELPVQRRLRGGEVQGGSTITQQLAKNELFTQEKQMARKAAEMFAARDIEDYYSKQQIFEMYAGSCYFGNQWSGVAQAAQGYFGKPTRELTRAECVVLAGLPNAPSVYAANGELARRRALVVVERMERTKKLTPLKASSLPGITPL